MLKSTRRNMQDVTVSKIPPFISWEEDLTEKKGKHMDRDTVNTVIDNLKKDCLPGPPLNFRFVPPSTWYWRLDSFFMTIIMTALFALCVFWLIDWFIYRFDYLVLYHFWHYYLWLLCGVRAYLIFLAVKTGIFLKKAGRFSSRSAVMLSPSAWEVAWLSFKNFRPPTCSFMPRLNNDDHY